MEKGREYLGALEYVWAQQNLLGHASIVLESVSDGGKENLSILPYYRAI